MISSLVSSRPVLSRTGRRGFGGISFWLGNLFIILRVDTLLNRCVLGWWMVGGFFEGYAWRRLLAWFIDILIVSLIVVLAFGEAALASGPLTAFIVAAGSALVGSVYFFVFSSLRATPGLALVRGSISAEPRARVMASMLFGAMLLPLGFALLVLDPAFDVLGSFGAEVIV